MSEAVFWMVVSAALLLACLLPWLMTWAMNRMDMRALADKWAADVRWLMERLQKARWLGVDDRGGYGNDVQKLEDDAFFVKVFYVALCYFVGRVVLFGVDVGAVCIAAFLLAHVFYLFLALRYGLLPAYQPPEFPYAKKSAFNMLRYSWRNWHKGGMDNLLRDRHAAKRLHVFVTLFILVWDGLHVSEAVVTGGIGGYSAISMLMFVLAVGILRTGSLHDLAHWLAHENRRVKILLGALWSVAWLVILLALYEEAAPIDRAGKVVVLVGVGLLFLLPLFYSVAGILRARRLSRD